MAQAPAPQYYRRNWTDFSGGLSTRQHALKINANQFTQLDNAITADHDLLEKAPGYTLDGSPWANVTDSFIRMIVEYRSGSSADQLVVAAQDDNNTDATYKVDLKKTSGDGTYSYIGYTNGTALFTHNSAVVTGTSTAWDVNLKAGDQIKPNSGSTWYVIQSVDSATQVTLTTTYSGTTTSSVAYMARIVLNYQAIPAAVTFNDRLIIVNGADPSMEYDNTTLTKLQSANAPAGAFVEVHKNRVFIARTSAGPSTLYWSAVNDETTWSASSKDAIYPEDNGNIVGIKSFANSLLVFKDNGRVYQVYGEFDQSAVGAPAIIRRVDTPDNIGTIAGRSPAINDDGLLYFISQTGIYTIDARMLVRKVSWDINPTVQGLIFSGNTTAAAKAFAFAQKSQWDTGTLAATQDVRPTNGIAPYFDSVTLSGAFQGSAAMACTMDSSKNVHIAWVASDMSTINYTKWNASDNSTSTQTAFTTSTSLNYQNNGVSNPLSLTSIAPIESVNVAIAIASNGNIGIASLIATQHSGSTGFYGVVFSEFSGGSWTNTGVLSFDFYTDPAQNGSISCTYNGGTSPYVAVTAARGVHAGNNKNGTGISFHTRSGSTWTVNYVNDPGVVTGESFYLDGSGNIHLVYSIDNLVYYAYSTNNGTSWTYPLTGSTLGTEWVTVSATALGAGSIHVAPDDVGNVILTCLFTSGTGSDVGKVLKYNLTPNTPTKTTIDTGAYSLVGYNNNAAGAETFYETNLGNEKLVYDVVYSTGTATITNGSTAVTGQGTKWTTWVQAGDKIKAGGDPESDYATVQTVNSDTSITLTGNYAGTSITAQAYLAKHTYSATASGTQFSFAYSSGDVGVFETAGVLAAVGPGTSAGALVARRVSPFAQWTSTVQSDSTLSSWGNFVATGVTPAGNTILFEIGLSTTGTILVVNTNPIANNTLISSDSTLNHAKLIISFTMLAFAAASVASAAMNYFAPGVSATGSSGMCGFVFNNELYLSCTRSGASQNDNILFLNWQRAWANRQVPVFCFARLTSNQTLYAGSSTGGNVYKLNTGYNAAGSAYSMTAITKEDILGDMELEKDLYKAYVIYKTQAGGTFTFSYSLDNYKNNGAPTWQDTVVTQTMASNTPGFQEIPIGQKCSSVQFKVAQNDADVQVGIIGIVLLYAYLNLR